MFTNMSYATRVAHSLLSQFGKTTKVVLEVHSHVITVRRCWDNKVIVRVYVHSLGDSLGTAPAAIVHSAQNEPLDMFTENEIVNGVLAFFIMNRNTWPRAGKNERTWSRPVYKIVEAY